MLNLDPAVAARVLYAAFVVHHDPPLIGDRAATRGRSATGSGDERAGPTQAPCASSLSSGELAPSARRNSDRSTPQRPQRTTRPGTRTLANNYCPPYEGMPIGGTRATVALELHSEGTDERISPASVAGNDASLIGERAATRGRPTTARPPRKTLRHARARR
jgi:hypothetical protein